MSLKMDSGDKMIALVHSHPHQLCSWATLVSSPTPYLCACLKEGVGQMEASLSSLRNLCLLEQCALWFQEERSRLPTAHPPLHRFSFLPSLMHWDLNPEPSFLHVCLYLRGQRIPSKPLIWVWECPSAGRVLTQHSESLGLNSYTKLSMVVHT